MSKPSDLGWLCSKKTPEGGSGGAFHVERCQILLLRPQTARTLSEKLTEPGKYLSFNLIHDD